MFVLPALRRAFCSLRTVVAPAYRPENHYMRGPGPACAAKVGVPAARGPARIAGQALG